MKKDITFADAVGCTKVATEWFDKFENEVKKTWTAFSHFSLRTPSCAVARDDATRMGERSGRHRAARIRSWSVEGAQHVHDPRSPEALGPLRDFASNHDKPARVRQQGPRNARQQ